MRLGIDRYDDQIAAVGANTLLIYGEAGTGRTRLALRSCLLEIKGGGRALYMSKGLPRLDEGMLEGDCNGLWIGSFLSPAQIPPVIAAVSPSLTVVDPINSWVECSPLLPSIRNLSLALFEILQAAEKAKSELILIGDVINSGEELKPRYYSVIKRYCDLVIGLKKDERFKEKRE
ncbi:MAG: hypothetical protein LUP94_01855 [Candidatus Methanomethylicus sp.]|nr:hypothetical protein [Candidatus Methanomethylicus sp.]